jgi:hypothetical protein
MKQDLNLGSTYLGHATRSAISLGSFGSSGTLQCVAIAVTHMDPGLRMGQIDSKCDLTVESHGIVPCWV